LDSIVKDEPSKAKALDSIAKDEPSKAKALYIAKVIDVWLVQT
jgi:hypothetical protein